MFKKILLLLSFFLLFGFNTFAQINFDFNSSYFYLKGSNAASLSSNWMSSDFDASGWTRANAPFRYGDGSGGFELTDMQNNYSTLYLRSSFNAQAVADIKQVAFNVNYDDGFIIWINGHEAFRRFAPENTSSTSFAPELHESGDVESVSINVDQLPLNEGENLVAIQGFNYSLESSDFYFDLKIQAVPEGPALPEVPDSLKIVFSQTGGFYDAPFSLTMNVPDNNYDIVYTIDGSNPQTSFTAINGGKSKTITIDPGSSNGRPRTPCFIVRASLAQADLKPSKPLTQTYIFINQVVNQKHPGGGWPTSNVNGQYIDLEMDDEVTRSSTYGNQMEDALLDIPSISVVTDLANLFGNEEGIYVNAEMHGIEWERFCSVELIDSKSNKEFNINAGLRIRGGWSRHDNYPKHAFRLFFREEYGEAKLNFPLFGDEGVEQFDKIDLRTAQNYAWSNGQDHNTFVREVFSRDSQRDMGQPYTRSSYYHLYLNGMYWGLFQTQERSEARYASDYFGGQAEDYDVIKVNGDFSYTIEATDGNTDAWRKLWDACNEGFRSNFQYFALEGKDRNGEPVKWKEKLLDIDNFIDYMITIFYAGNFDAPVSAFSGNQNPNNFYAIYKRDDRSKGFIFFNHDAEHSLMIDAISPGIGVYENRVDIPGLNVGSFSKFHPQWLHHKLSENAEYRQRFSDRVYKHFYNDGVFTPEKAEERFMKRTKDISKAIIAESARWGDAGGRLRTRDNDWLPEIEDIQQRFFPERTDIVLDQLIDADLYFLVNTPKFKVNNELVENNSYKFNNTADIVISSSTPSVNLYYSTNGTDPRSVGGNVNSDAIEIENGGVVKIKGSTEIKCRAKKGNEWSAMHTVRFVKNWEDYYNLKVTELNYHPTDSIIGTDTISGKSFEFIELKNVGSHAVDLSRLNFLTSIDFHFGSDALIYPDDFYVVASSSKWFFERYGRAPSAVYNNALSNSGELVTVMSDDGRLVFGFEYFNQNPWPVETDSTGYTLTSAQIYPLGDPNDPSYWKASTHIGGSPFYNDTRFPVGINDELEDVSALQVYPNPASDYLFLKLMVEDPVDIEIYTLTGRKVFSEQLNNNAVINLGKLNIQPGILLVKTNCRGEQKISKILYK